MGYLALTIETNHPGVQAVTEFLSAQGIDDVVIEDPEELRELLLSQGESAEEAEGPAKVTFYLPAAEDGFARLAQVRIALTEFRKAHADCGSLLMLLKETEESDWADNWKQYWSATPVGEHLVIVPAWEENPEPWRIPLRMDPGRTFGSGGHTTTRLCLERIEQRIRGGERVLDIGCGSGILAIAALKLGAASAYACDLDERCPEVVRENAERNGVAAESYTVRCGDILTDDAMRQEIGGGYDLVLANIVSDVILGLAPHVRPLLSEGGAFLCSGIIDTRADELERALRDAGLTVRERVEEDGWCAFLCE